MTGMEWTCHLQTCSGDPQLLLKSINQKPVSDKTDYLLQRQHVAEMGGIGNTSLSLKYRFFAKPMRREFFILEFDLYLLIPVSATCCPQVGHHNYDR